MTMFKLTEKDRLVVCEAADLLRSAALGNAITTEEARSACLNLFAILWMPDTQPTLNEEPPKGSQ